MAESPLNKYLKYGCSADALFSFIRDCILPADKNRFYALVNDIHNASMALLDSPKYYSFSVKDKAVTMNVCAYCEMRDPLTGRIREGSRDPTIGQIYFTRSTFALAGNPMDFLNLNGGGPVNM